MKTLLAILLFAALAVAQSDPPVKPGDQPVALTDQEQTAIELLSVKRANLALRYELLQQQFNQTPEVKQILEENAALTAQQKKLVAAAAKAHQVDLAKFQLAPDGKSFVQIEKQVAKAVPPEEPAK